MDASSLLFFPPALPFLLAFLLFVFFHCLDGDWYPGIRLREDRNQPTVRIHGSLTAGELREYPSLGKLANESVLSNQVRLLPIASIGRRRRYL